MKLAHRKVLVTGATTGIGAALTEQLLGMGCHVIACGRRASAIEALGKRPNVTAIRIDLNDEADVRRLADIVRRDHPDLSVLINNAGIQHEVRVAGTETARLLELSDIETRVNYAAPVMLTLLLLEPLAKRPEAAIVNVTSPLAMAPKRSSPFYGATKAGLRTFTKSLRYQLERDYPHIEVIEAQPPLVDTEMTRGRGRGKISPEQAAAGILKGIVRGQREIHVGKAKLMYVLCRWMPSVAENITKRW
jgi:uncharacterized oxidoreductase